MNGAVLDLDAVLQLREGDVRELLTECIGVHERRGERVLFQVIRHCDQRGVVVQFAVQQGDVRHTVKLLLVQAEVRSQGCGEGELRIAVPLHVGRGDEGLAEILEFREQRGDIDAFEVRVDGQRIRGGWPGVELQATAHAAFRSFECQRFQCKSLARHPHVAGDLSG